MKLPQPFLHREQLLVQFLQLSVKGSAVMGEGPTFASTLCRDPLGGLAALLGKESVLRDRPSSRLRKVTLPLFTQA